MPTALQPPTLLYRAVAIMGMNTVIALGLTTVSDYQGWWGNLVYSQCIGLSIWVLSELARHRLAPQGRVSPGQMALIVPVAVLAGYFGGRRLGDLLYGMHPGHPLVESPNVTLGFLLLSLVAGGFGAYWFMSRELLAAARLAQQEAQRQASEARLKLLETQLEPHMLFNTLANLRVLIGLDPERAITMLDHMNNYLRATLGGSRASLHPLQAEFDRLADYLALMAIRMGPRLRYRLDLPDDLRSLPVPPLLLQPLVENAIRHGLEPQVAGGAITVSARRRADQRIALEVCDSGVGLTAAAPEGSPGFGLAQVRERLLATYGPDAAMTAGPGDGGGTRICLELPAP